jgi:predicted dehydrogenase
MKMNIGIIGAGVIAETMAKTLAGMKDEGVSAYAVAARDLGRAQNFAKTHGFTTAYGSYEELVHDPKVDLVYVATVHSLHFAHVKLCLNAGKAVLCEKAFMVNAKEAREVLALAEQKKVLLAEAIWTRYLPMRRKIDEILAGGAIGTPSSLYASLSYPMAQKERILRPELGGGALLDIGVYPINFALMCFGSDTAKVASATTVKGSTGVDMADTAVLTWDDGRMATVHCDARARSDRGGWVYGDKGYVQVLNINNCEGIRVFDLDDKLVASYETPPQITGFEYQVRACKKAFESGKTECTEMPHSEILCVMDIMDRIRAF